MRKNFCLMVLCVCIVIITGLSTAGATIYNIPVYYDYSSHYATNYPNYGNYSYGGLLPSDNLQVAYGSGINMGIIGYTTLPFGGQIPIFGLYNWEYTDSSYLEFDFGQLQTLQGESITSATINFTYQGGNGSPLLSHWAGGVYETAGIIDSQNGWSADVTSFILADAAGSDYWSEWSLTPFGSFSSGIALGSLEGGHPAYLSITTAAVSSVPLPPSVLLLGSGLLGLVGLRRFRKS